MVRNQALVETSLGLYYLLGRNKIHQWLDFGGGVGVFTRCMRDLGVNVFWQDRHCENILAKGFEGDVTDPYDLVSSFEVWEHLADVSGELQALFSARPSFLFVHTLLRWDLDPSWWYLAPETGQHIAFYSQKTMNFIAQKFGYRAFAGHTYTLFVSRDSKLEPWKYSVLQTLMYRPQWISQYGKIIHALKPIASLSTHDAQAVLK